MLSYDVWEADGEGLMWLGYLLEIRNEHKSVWDAYAAPGWGMRTSGVSEVLVGEYTTRQEAFTALREYWGFDV